MIRKLLSVALIFALGLSFVSCEEDENDFNSSLADMHKGTLPIYGTKSVVALHTYSYHVPGQTGHKYQWTITGAEKVGETNSNPVELESDHLAKVSVKMGTTQSVTIKMDETGKSGNAMHSTTLNLSLNTDAPTVKSLKLNNEELMNGTIDTFWVTFDLPVQNPKIKFEGITNPVGEQNLQMVSSDTYQEKYFLPVTFSSTEETDTIKVSVFDAQNIVAPNEKMEETKYEFVVKNTTSSK